MHWKLWPLVLLAGCGVETTPDAEDADAGGYEWDYDGISCELPPCYSCGYVSCEDRLAVVEACVDGSCQSQTARCDYGCDPEAVEAIRASLDHGVEPESLCRQVRPAQGDPCESSSDCSPTGCVQMICDDASSTCLIDVDDVAPVDTSPRPSASLQVRFADETPWSLPVAVESCAGIVVERLDTDDETYVPMVNELPGVPRCSCDGCDEVLSATDIWETRDVEQTSYALSVPWQAVEQVSSALECCDQGGAVEVSPLSIRDLDEGTYRVRVALRSVSAEPSEVQVAWDQIEAGLPRCEADTWVVSEPLHYVPGADPPAFLLEW